MAKRSLASLSADELRGKRVLVRVDFNVPLDEAGAITDDTRIRAALPTINDLIGKGARVILAAHFGRPKGQVNEGMRLTPVAARLSELLGKPVVKTDSCIGPDAEAKVAAMAEGDVVLLENVRFFAEEEKNDAGFAAELARLADVYVNDAFGAAHRAHASTEGVTKALSPSVAGYLMEKELQYLQGAIDEPKRPLAAIVGGSKVSSKIGVLEALLDKCDKILVGGGMIFTFYKARGLAVGKSLVEEDKLELAKELEAKAAAKGVQFLLPTDVVLADNFAPDANSQIADVNAIPDGWMGLDIGPDSVKVFQDALADCKTVIWNGPMGVFEFDAFAAADDRAAALAAQVGQGGGDGVGAGGEGVEFEHAHGAVPDHGLAVGQGLLEHRHRVGADVEAHPAIGDRLHLGDLAVGVRGEVVGQHHIGGQQELHALGGCLGLQLLGQLQLVLLHKALAHREAARLVEGEDHAAADQDLVALVDQGLDIGPDSVAVFQDCLLYTSDAADE